MIRKNVKVLDIFSSLSVLSDYVKHFGAWAPVVAFLLFAIQAALPVFPYIVLAAAGGMLFGLKLGFLLAWTGALTGACLCYWVCKLLGHNPLSNWLYSRYGYDVDNYNPNIAFWTIVVSRIMPFVPTPFINIAAALGGVSFGNFLLASAIGKIPTAFLYTCVGLAIFNARDINTILIVITVTIILLLGFRVLARKIFPKSKLEPSKDLGA